MPSDDGTLDGPTKDESPTLRDLRASPVHELAPGTVLAARYRIIGPAGAGGMGAVYEAEQIELERRVALKLVLNSEGESFERLRREALGASAVQSPHVVSVFDFHWEEGEPPFLVMELLEGRSLESLMEAEGALPFGQAARLSCQVLDGLSAAHRAGLVHRDVKPANVWLVPTMNGDLAKLLDFGLVKSLDDAVGLTARSGRVMGTRAYLAPEQIHKLPADPRSDLHAVGVMLWEMIAGRRLWKSKGPDVFAEIVARTPENLTALLPDVPLGLADAVARALSKDPEGRFRDAAEMYDALLPYAVLARVSVPAEDPYETPAAVTEAMPAPRTLPSATDGTTSSAPRRTPRMGATAPLPPFGATLPSAQGAAAAGPLATNQTLRSGQAPRTKPPGAPSLAAPAPAPRDALAPHGRGPAAISRPEPSARALSSAAAAPRPLPLAAWHDASAPAPLPRREKTIPIGLIVLAIVASCLALLVGWLALGVRSPRQAAPSSGPPEGMTAAPGLRR